MGFLLTAHSTFIVHLKGSVPRAGSSRNSEISLSTVVPNLFWLWYTYTRFQKYILQSGAQWNENLELIEYKMGGDTGHSFAF